MFNTGNPPQDAQSYIQWLDKQPSLLAENKTCDLCCYKGDVIDMIEAPDKGGWYCQDCFIIGDVKSYLLRAGDLTKEEITNYINSIKI